MTYPRSTAGQWRSRGFKSLPISTVQDLAPGSPAFSTSQGPGQGDTGTFQLQKWPVRGSPELCWRGWASGPAWGHPASGPPWQLRSPLDYSPESRRSCHLGPWGVTADTDGDRQEDTQAGALT